MVKEITEMNQFLSCLKEYNVSKNSYQTLSYYEVYSKYNPVKNFYCLVIYDEKEIKGILPLFKQHFYFAIYGHRASNYLGIICKDNDIPYVDQQIQEHLQKKSIIINYYDINDSTKFYEYLNLQKMITKIFLYSCPYVDVQMNFHDLFTRNVKSSKKRMELRKFNRKLDLVGNVSFLNIRDLESWNECKQYFDEIFNIHEQRFANVYIQKDFNLHENKEYFTELFENMVKERKAFLSLLLIDNTVVSFLYMLISDDIIMDWMPAFDPAFSKYSLGTVHLMRLIEYLCEDEKISILDFSKGSGVYKKRWANGSTNNYMFIRRFNNKISSRTKQLVLSKIYLFKTFLREKSILQKIKLFIGKFNKKNDKNQSTTNTSNIYEAKGKEIPYHYNKINDFTIEDKKMILDHIYNGKKVKLFEYEAKISYLLID